MPRIRICPIDLSAPSTEIIVADVSIVLNVMPRMICKDADVECDGTYAFSVRVDANGVWSIYQRNHATRPVGKERSD